MAPDLSADSLDAIAQQVNDRVLRIEIARLDMTDDSILIAGVPDDYDQQDQHHVAERLKTLIGTRRVVVIPKTILLTIMQFDTSGYSIGDPLNPEPT